LCGMMPSPPVRLSAPAPDLQRFKPSGPPFRPAPRIRPRSPSSRPSCPRHRSPQRPRLRPTPIGAGKSAAYGFSKADDADRIQAAVIAHFRRVKMPGRLTQACNRLQPSIRSRGSPHPQQPSTDRPDHHFGGQQ
jgi:hypothetical protein